MKVQVGSGFLPHEIEDELLRFSSEIEKVVQQVIDADREATTKRIDYDKAYATAILSVEGKNVEERKAKAFLAVAVEHTEAEIADLLLRTAKRRLAELERKIDILRTFSANLRNQSL